MEQRRSATRLERRASIHDASGETSPQIVAAPLPRLRDGGENGGRGRHRKPLTVRTLAAVREAGWSGS